MSIQLAPNPIKGDEFTMQVIYPPDDPCDTYSTQDYATIIINNGNGQEIYKKKHKGKEIKIKSNKLKSGIYFVNYIYKTKKISKKLVVE